jgi:uncharacterized low-complexity protein
MRKLLLLAALSLSLAAVAQSIEKNTQGADVDPKGVDPAAKARVRSEGSAGGTGAQIPQDARGEAKVGEGGQNRHSTPNPRLGAPSKAEPKDPDEKRRPQ